MSSDRIPEDERSLIEEVEHGLRDQIVDSSEVENYEEIEDFFESKKETKKYLESYHNFFGEYKGALEYLEQWEENYGDISNITKSLSE